MTAPSIPVTAVRLRDTHRLIPSRYSAAGTVLSRLAAAAPAPALHPADPSGGAAASDDLLAGLMELDDATNDRFLGEDGLLAGISLRELVFGVRYAHIVNAAFTHASPTGGRFNSATRGAWYAAVERPTALAEIAFHRQRQLEEVRWPDPETSTVDDYLADLAAPLHDLRSATEPSPFAAWLQPGPIPACYTEPQALAARLLAQRSDGVLYPSVRRRGGTCVACFRPALVYNVRRGARLELTLAAGRPFRPREAREVSIPDDVAPSPETA